MFRYFFLYKNFTFLHSNFHKCRRLTAFPRHSKKTRYTWIHSASRLQSFPPLATRFRGSHDWKVKNKIITLPSRPRHPRIFLPPSEQRFWSREFVSKPITWYIEMHHVRTFFSVWRHGFFVLRDVHSQRVYLQEESLRPFLSCRMHQKKPLRFCPDDILSSADKQWSWWQFYGRQKAR